MKRLLAATATLSLLAAAGPALAAPSKNGACTAPAGATVIKPGARAVESSPATPVGAFNTTAEDAGSFVLDLGGKPQGATGKLTFTLSWANPASDYDLVVSGTNDEAVENPEIRTFKAKHCKPVLLEVSVYAGVPVDDLTLAVKGA